MAKKVKYYLGFNTFNTPFTTITITQKQYNELLRKYGNIVAENHKLNTSDDTEYYVEQKVRTYVHDRYTEEITEFNDGPSYILLGKMVCKDGFQWK